MIFCDGTISQARDMKLKRQYALSHTNTGATHWQHCRHLGTLSVTEYVVKRFACLGNIHLQNWLYFT